MTHCTICHTDYAPGQYHSCGGCPTPCTAECVKDDAAVANVLSEFPDAQVRVRNLETKS